MVRSADALRHPDPRRDLVGLAARWGMKLSTRAAVVSWVVLGVLTTA